MGFAWVFSHQMYEDKHPCMLYKMTVTAQGFPSNAKAPTYNAIMHRKHLYQGSVKSMISYMFSATQNARIPAIHGLLSILVCYLDTEIWRFQTLWQKTTQYLVAVITQYHLLSYVYQYLDDLIIQCYLYLVFFIPAKPLHNSDTLSGHFNLFYCTDICDKLRWDLPWMSVD